MTDLARRVAYEVLRRIDHDGAYANLTLGPALARSDLDPRQRRFATELVYGATRMRRACDALVDRFVTQAPDPATRTLLRLGAYQIEFTEVPAHAAVSETVGLAPRRTRGFVNAVLRRVADTPMVWPSGWARLSYPDWIGERFVAELGEADAVAALERMNLAPEVTTRADGYVQDESSQWVADAVGARSGETVLDVCAAPGGKATALAATGATVIAGDVRAARVRQVRDNAATTGQALDVIVADARQNPFRPGCADAVLVDAPCSGLGVLRRRADARWRVAASDIDQLAGLQRQILSAAATLVRPGGRLVYSVCTITAAETVELPVPDGFDIDPTPPERGRWRSFGPAWRVLPQDADTDGMVLIRYRRRA